MKLWCLDEGHARVRWGRAIHARAVARGWDCHLFTRFDEIGPGPAYVFMRIEQWPPYLQAHKALAQEIFDKRPDLTVIPDAKQIGWYEDKIAQARDLMPWMPRTRVLYSISEIAGAVRALGLPLISKSAEGSSCANVRVVKDHDAALAEANAVFGGGGLPIRLGGEGNQHARQTGYLFWQKFLKGNPHIYRVGVCGRLKWLFREGNRPGTQLASGSGIYAPVDRLEGETRAVFDAAAAFVKETGQKWCGLDYAKDPDTGQWKVLETTLAWGMIDPRSTSGCMLFDENGKPTGRRGVDLWDALLDEIEAGAFA
jgi:hypothetical protein